MNERIRQLAVEAFFDEATDVSTDKMYHFGEEKMQKFAELIIKECASIVYKTCQDGDAGAQAILYEFDIDNAKSQK